MYVSGWLSNGFIYKRSIHLFRGGPENCVGFAVLLFVQDFLNSNEEFKHL